MPTKFQEAQISCSDSCSNIYPSNMSTSKMLTWDKAITAASDVRNNGKSSSCSEIVTSVPLGWQEFHKCFRRMDHFHITKAYFMQLPTSIRKLTVNFNARSSLTQDFKNESAINSVADLRCLHICVHFLWQSGSCVTRTLQLFGLFGVD